MASKGIPKFCLFDRFFQKISCPLFGVPSRYEKYLFLSSYLGDESLIQTLVET